MSDTLSREQRRNIRRTLGETAAGAMAECKAEVQKVRSAHVSMLETLRVFDVRTKRHDEQIKAALQLGFDNEKLGSVNENQLLQEIVDRNTGDNTLRSDILPDLLALKAIAKRPFFGRLKWLVFGR